MSGIIRKGAGTLLVLLSPHDESADPPAVISSDTVTGQLFDDAADTVATQAHTPGAQILFVANPNAFEVGDDAHIELDDGTFDSLEVGAIDVAAGTITTLVGLTSASAAGSRFAKKLGADLTLTAFGTPVLRSFEPRWGFQATITPTHGGLIVGQEVRAEIRYASGNGLEIIRGTVVGPF